jgi:hypothetical protein
VRAPGRLGLSLRAGIEEPQRRTGQLYPAQGGVLDVDQEALGERLVPAVDLVDRADLPGRDAGGGEPGQQLLGGNVGERALEQFDDLLPVPDPLAVGGQARGVGVEVELRAELSPQRLGAAGELDAAPLAVEQAVGRDRRVVVALGAADLAGDGPRRPLEGVHADDRGQQRRAHHLAAAGLLALHQRGQHAVGAVHAGQQVADRHAHPLGVVRPGPGQRHQAGLTLGDLVVAGAPTLGPVVAEAADRQLHQPRVQLGQHVGAEAEAGQRAGPEVLQQHVRTPQQLGEHRLVVVVLEVEGDRLLVAVGGQEVRRLPVAGVRLHERRAPAAGVVPAAGVLHLDHPGAEVAEHHPGVRPGEGPGQVDDENAVERSTHGSTPIRFRASWG